MEREMEIEYKTLVTKEKYVELKALLSQFAEEKEGYEQVNYFFDSSDQLLNQKGITLRLRYKKNAWQLTAKLKQKQDETSYVTHQELNDVISEEKAKTYLENGIDPNEHVVMKMMELAGIEEPIPFILLGSLVTRRIDFAFYEDTISIDRNFYNGVIDYELEWETANHTFVRFINERFLFVDFDNGCGKRKRFLKSLSR